MNGQSSILSAILMGIVSVDLFCRAWMGLMTLIATAVLRHRDEIARQEALARAHRGVLSLLFCGGLLAVVFHLYSNVYGLGTSPGECLAYLLAATVRMVVFLKDVSHRVDRMLRPGGPDQH